MKAIKHDKVSAAVGTAFTIAAVTGIVVSGLNKSEKIAVTAEVESVKEAEAKTKVNNGMLSLEREDNILISATLNEFMETAPELESVKKETSVQETETQTEVQTEAPTEVQTEAPTEVQTEASTEAPTEPYVYENTFLVNVNEYLNVRAEGSQDAAIVGKIYAGGGGEVLEKGAEWSKIQSGNVVGYIKNEYAWFSHDAEANFATHCQLTATVNADALRLRKGAGTDYKVQQVVNSGTEMNAVSNDGEWVAVTYEGETLYASAQYVSLEYTIGKGITIEEEQAAIAEEKRRQEEAAEKARLAAEKAEAEKKKQMEAAQISDTIQTSAYNVSEDEAYLLACVVMAEAGGECYEGKLAVANIVLNRLNSGKYGDSISDVVYAKKQFSVVDNGALSRYLSKGPNAASVRAAKEALSGINNVPNYTSFCTTAVAKCSRYRAYSVIGNQVFYR